MKRSAGSFLLVAPLAALTSLPAAAAAPDAPKIVVGPNVLASRDGNFPHVELHISANPKDARNLLGGAITYTQPGGGTACRTYATQDGGASWHASAFPEQVEWGGGDPYTAFTPQGTAVFCALTMAKDENDRTRAFLHVWRSEDGGRSWGKPADLGYSYDFQKMTVDQTTGKYAGRLYIAALHGYPEYLVSVFRSEDDGRTWKGPVRAASGGGKVGIGAVNVVVLSDGTLVVPLVEYEFQPDKVKRTGWVTRPQSLVLSEDGGVRFGPPRKAPAVRFNMDDPSSSQAFHNAQLAADTSTKERLDRLYMVWADSRHGKTRLLFSRSTDRGKSWTEPMLLDGKVPKDSMQFQPSIAVNKDGVVGVSWFDTRDSKDGSEYHEYFAASVDGGKAFLPSARVSSAPSNPRGEGNMTLAPMVFEHKEESYLSLVSAANRWLGGGDYMGLTADKDGVFHPFWADSRSGTFQAYTARVSVVMPAREKPAPGTPGLAAAGPPSRPAEPGPRTRSSLQKRVQILFDPTRYDMSKREADIPVRLKNTSREPIHPPITLEIAGFDYDDPELPKSDSPPPAVVNAANGKPGVGATFDFSGAIGSSEALEPDAQTSPVVIRLKFEDPLKIPPIRLKAEGMVGTSK